HVGERDEGRDAAQDLGADGRPGGAQLEETVEHPAGSYEPARARVKPVDGAPCATASTRGMSPGEGRFHADIHALIRYPDVRPAPHRGRLPLPLARHGAAVRLPRCASPGR